MIKSGGEWISSVDLESALMAHPAVFEAAVIAVPDERWSERPFACVVAAEGTDAAELTEFLAGREFAALVAARRLRLRRRDPEDERRQVRQEGAARRVR